jgi:hypothetical protein
MALYGQVNTSLLPKVGAVLWGDVRERPWILQKFNLSLLGADEMELGEVVVKCGCGRVLAR